MNRRRHVVVTAVLIALIGVFFCLPSSAHELDGSDSSGSCPFSSPTHSHHHHHHENHADHRKLPEEIAEEEDLMMESSVSSDEHDHLHHIHRPNQDLSTVGLWVNAMGCSLLVSFASLICLVLLPVLFVKGTPSKVLVDALATFGAGAMLGDAFLHQLPHAFSGGHSHSHSHSHSHDHYTHESHEVPHADSHAHSLQDLSVGLSVLLGIVLFLLVEKVVRYVEEVSSNGAHIWGHGHHHHRNHLNLKNDHTSKDGKQSEFGNVSKMENMLEEKREKMKKRRKRGKGRGEENGDSSSSSVPRITPNERTNHDSPATSAKKSDHVKDTTRKEIKSCSGESSSSLVFGYLNLFSDGVHNFTDGMALGSAFLLHGSVGGWSRTLFLLAHELPQEVGDFGILVRSGFTVPKALFFNFLSALVALVGTAMALLLGQDPGQSSLIEGFTAGGFIYIAVAGVLPELNSGSTTFRSTSIQLAALISGMAVALCISLAE